MNRAAPIPAYHLRGIAMPAPKCSCGARATSRLAQRAYRWACDRCARSRVEREKAMWMPLIAGQLVPVPSWCKGDLRRIAIAVRYRDKTIRRVAGFGVKNLENMAVAASIVGIRRASKRAYRCKPCVACGCPKVVGHHWDYSKPFLVIWLCHSCHAVVHHIIKGACR